jgi:hypothetical protein
VALNIDPSRPLRTIPQLTALLEAIDGAEPGDESFAVEWKRTLELNKASGRFAIAKCILGMGNRAVEAAGRSFGGLGYMVVGMEPRNVVGMPSIDYADLQPQIEAYTGEDGPSWSPQQVTYEGQNILVITVEAPADGDRIHPLRKSYQSDQRGERGHDKGAILVRHHAMTEPATVADIRELERRLLAGQPSVEAIDDIVATPSGAVQVIQVTDDAVNKRQTEEEEAFPPQADVTSGPASTPFGLPTFKVNTTPQAERERYERERVRYLHAFNAALKPHSIRTAVERHPAPFELAITNNSRTALQELEIRVTVPEGVQIFGANDDLGQMPRPPKPPSNSVIASFQDNIDWQQHTSAALRANFDHFSISRKRREVTFTIRSIHAGQTEKTDSVLLVTGTGRISGEAPSTRWDAEVHITASNRADAWHGSVQLGPTSSMLADGQLLPRATIVT